MTTPARTLFTLFGIPVTVTSQSWQFVPPKLVIGFLVSFALLPDEPLIGHVVWGLIYGLVLISTLCLHIFGHISTSKLVAPPMTELRISPILIQTLYGYDNADTPHKVHLIRSIGGPLMNLTLGLTTLLWWTTIGGHVLLFFALANLVLTAIVLLPLRGVDGEVIWREVWQSLRHK